MAVVSADFRVLTLRHLKWRSTITLRSPPDRRSQCAVYAPVSMIDLKVSVTASIGMQARHRMPPLQF
jgi:hypothetical protein